MTVPMSFMQESKDIYPRILETNPWILRTGEMANPDALSYYTFCAIIRLLYHSTFFFYRKIVLLGDIKSKPINPAGVTYGGLKGAYQA